MRTVTKNPRDTIPNFNETDRYKNLILFDVQYSSCGNIKHEIICITNRFSHAYGNIMQLRGNDLRNDNCRDYGWVSCTASTLEYVTNIWNCWKQNIPDIIISLYVIETRTELIEFLASLGATPGFTNQILDMFPRR